jgi:hypothetical protein
MRKLSLLALCAILLTGCFSDDTDTAAKKNKGPQFKTGLSAFSGLYATARMWSSDAEPVKLQSQDATGSTGKDGKALVWRGLFASPAKSSLRAYTWSGATSDDAPPPGITPGSEDTYNPRNISTRIFAVGAIRTDSAQALEIAQQHGGKAILTKAPDMIVRYELSGDRDKGQLTWYVSYGPNPDAPELKVAVDCESGTFLRVVK